MGKPKGPLPKRVHIEWTLPETVKLIELYHSGLNWPGICQLLSGRGVQACQQRLVRILRRFPGKGYKRKLAKLYADLSQHKDIARQIVKRWLELEGRDEHKCRRSHQWEPEQDDWLLSRRHEYEETWRDTSAAISVAFGIYLTPSALRQRFTRLWEQKLRTSMLESS